MANERQDSQLTPDNDIFRMEKFGLRNILHRYRERSVVNDCAHSGHDSLLRMTELVGSGRKVGVQEKEKMLPPHPDNVAIEVRHSDDSERIIQAAMHLSGYRSFQRSEREVV
jgi:hypothetical protein